MIDRLYTPAGYIDMGAVISAPYPFILVIGARGVGKTYGALSDVALDHPQRFIYFRRSRAIIDLLMEPALQPFKRINADRETDIRPDYKKGIGRFYNGEELLGYAAALSTFANIRGFDGSDIDIMIYDEFIPEPAEIVRFNSYLALLNAYETINRNREFEGRPPLKLLLLSNSDNIYNDIVSGFGVGDDLYYMQQTGIEQKEHNGMLLIRPAADDFKSRKAETVLYKVANSEFQNVALNNKFLIETEQNIRQRPLKEYIPQAEICGIVIYKHKSTGRYYVSFKRSGTPREYGPGEAERRRYLRENAGVWRAYERRRIDFESVNAQTAFRKIYT